MVSSAMVAAAIARGQEEARLKGWSEPVGSASYNARYGIYQVRFFSQATTMVPEGSAFGGSISTGRTVPISAS